MGNATQPPTKRFLQFTAKTFVGPGLNVFRLFLRMAPDQRAATIRHRQHRQRTVLREALKRPAVVFCGSRDVRNDRNLPVRLLLPLNAALGCERRARPVRRHKKLAVENGAIIQRHADRFFTAGKARNA